MNENTIVISLGGSIVVPDEINASFLKGFESLIRKISQTKKIILVVGGGKTARRYIDSLKNFEIDDVQKDWIGIMATRLNAQLVKSIFNDIASEKVVYDPEKDIKFEKRVLVAAGYKPGWSTDYVASLLAVKFNANTLINLSNIYYVFDKDPNKWSDAVRLEKTDWETMQKIVGTEWKPGLNAPFDPVTTKLCREKKLKVIITNGTDLENLSEILNDREVKCTKIEN
jgi:uridylate kinase